MLIIENEIREEAELILGKKLTNEILDAIREVQKEKGELEREVSPWGKERYTATIHWVRKGKDLQELGLTIKKTNPIRFDLFSEVIVHELHVELSISRDSSSGTISTKGEMNRNPFRFSSLLTVKDKDVSWKGEGTIQLGDEVDLGFTCSISNLFTKPQFSLLPTQKTIDSVGVWSLNKMVELTGVEFLPVAIPQNIKDTLESALFQQIDFDLDIKEKSFGVKTKLEWYKGLIAATDFHWSHDRVSIETTFEGGIEVVELCQTLGIRELSDVKGIQLQPHRLSIKSSGDYTLISSISYQNEWISDFKLENVSLNYSSKEERFELSGRANLDWSVPYFKGDVASNASLKFQKSNESISIDLIGSLVWKEQSFAFVYNVHESEHFFKAELQNTSAMKMLAPWGVEKLPLGIKDVQLDIITLELKGKEAIHVSGSGKVSEAHLDHSTITIDQLSIDYNWKEGEDETLSIVLDSALNWENVLSLEKSELKFDLEKQQNKIGWKLDHQAKVTLFEHEFQSHFSWNHSDKEELKIVVKNLENLEVVEGCSLSCKSFECNMVYTPGKEIELTMENTVDVTSPVVKFEDAEWKLELNEEAFTFLVKKESPLAVHFIEGWPTVLVNSIRVEFQRFEESQQKRLFADVVFEGGNWGIANLVPSLSTKLEVVKTDTQFILVGDLETTLQLGENVEAIPTHCHYKLLKEIGHPIQLELNGGFVWNEIQFAYDLSTEKSGTTFHASAKSISLNRIIQNLGGEQLPLGIADVTIDQLDFTINSNKSVRIKGELSHLEMDVLPGADLNVSSIVFDAQYDVNGALQVFVELESSMAIPGLFELDQSKLRFELKMEGSNRKWLLHQSSEVKVFERTFNATLGYEYANGHELNIVVEKVGELSIIDGISLKSDRLAFQLKQSNGKPLQLHLESKADFKSEIIDFENAVLTLDKKGTTYSLKCLADGTIDLKIIDSIPYLSIHKMFCFNYTQTEKGWDTEFYTNVEVKAAQEILDVIGHIIPSQKIKAILHATTELLELKLQIEDPLIAIDLGKIAKEIGADDWLALDTLYLGPDAFVVRIPKAKGKKLQIDGQMLLGLPANLNEVFKWGDHQIDLFKTCKRGNKSQAIPMGLKLDQSGFSISLDKLPFNTEILEKPNAVFDYIAYDKGRLKFKLKDNGSVNMKIPEFKLDGDKLRAVGDFVFDDFKLPLTPLKLLLRWMKLDTMANELTDGIPIKGINFAPVENGVRRFKADAFLSLLKEGDKRFEYPGWLNDILKTTENIADFLPQSLLEYGDFEIPKALAYDFEFSQPGNLKFNVSCKEEGKSREETIPLKLLLPNPPMLTGLKIYSIGFGELLNGSLFRLDVDMDIDNIDVPRYFASKLLNETGVFKDQLPDPHTLHNRLVIENLVTLIVYQTEIPIPIPLFYDRLAVESISAEGFESTLDIAFPMPRLGMDMALKFGKLAYLMYQFAKNRAFTDDQKKQLDEVDILEFELTKLHFQFPKYVVKDRQTNDGLAWDLEKVKIGPIKLLNRFLQALIANDLAPLIELINVDQRIANKDVKLFNLLDANFKYAFTTPQEFVEHAVDKLRLDVENPGQIDFVPLPSSVTYNPKHLPETVSNNLKTSKGLITYLEGSLTNNSSFITKANCGLLLTNKGIGIGGRFLFEVQDTVHVDLKGALTVLPESLRIKGSSNLTLFNETILDGSFDLNNEKLTFSGKVDLFPAHLFPDRKIIVEGEIAGSIAPNDMHVSGDSRVVVLGNTLQESELILIANSTELYYQLKGELFGNAYDVKAYADKNSRALVFDGNVLEPIDWMGLIKLSGTDESYGPAMKLAINDRAGVDQFYLDTKLSILGMSQTGLQVAIDENKWAVDFNSEINIAGFLHGHARFRGVVVPGYSFVLDGDVGGGIGFTIPAVKLYFSVFGHTVSVTIVPERSFSLDFNNRVNIKAYRGKEIQENIEALKDKMNRHLLDKGNLDKELVDLKTKLKEEKASGHNKYYNECEAIADRFKREEIDPLSSRLSDKADRIAKEVLNWLENVHDSITAEKEEQLNQLLNEYFSLCDQMGYNSFKGKEAYENAFGLVDVIKDKVKKGKLIAIITHFHYSFVRSGSHTLRESLGAQFRDNHVADEVILKFNENGEFGIYQGPYVLGKRAGEEVYDFFSNLDKVEWFTTEHYINDSLFRRGYTLNNGDLRMYKVSSNKVAQYRTKDVSNDAFRLMKRHLQGKVDEGTFKMLYSDQGIFRYKDNDEYLNIAYATDRYAADYIDVISDGDKYILKQIDGYYLTFEKTGENYIYAKWSPNDEGDRYDLIYNESDGAYIIKTGLYYLVIPGIAGKHRQLQFRKKNPDGSEPIQDRFRLYREIKSNVLEQLPKQLASIEEKVNTRPDKVHPGSLMVDPRYVKVFAMREEDDFKKLFFLEEKIFEVKEQQLAKKEEIDELERKLDGLNQKLDESKVYFFLHFDSSFVLNGREHKLVDMNFELDIKSGLTIDGVLGKMKEELGKYIKNNKVRLLKQIAFGVSAPVGMLPQNSSSSVGETLKTPEGLYRTYEIEPEANVDPKLMGSSTVNSTEYIGMDEFIGGDKSKVVTCNIE